MTLDIHDAVSAAHENLIFNIPSSVRCIFLEVGEDELVFRAVFHRQYSEKEKGCIFDAVYDTAAALCISEYKCECVVSDAPFGELDKLPQWLYVRAEESADWDD